MEALDRAGLRRLLSLYRGGVFDHTHKSLLQALASSNYHDKRKGDGANAATGAVMVGASAALQPVSITPILCALLARWKVPCKSAPFGWGTFAFALESKLVCLRS